MSGTKITTKIILSPTYLVLSKEIFAVSGGRFRSAHLPEIHVEMAALTIAQVLRAGQRGITLCAWRANRNQLIHSFAKIPEITLEGSRRRRRGHELGKKRLIIEKEEQKRVKSYRNVVDTDDGRNSMGQNKVGQRIQFVCTRMK